jgi:drug/metabolite transporter (DMT)-like permease
MPPSAIPSATLALCAFAANSVLCRLALRDTTIDPATFSTIRVASGAAMLLLVAVPRDRGDLGRIGSWTSAALLALYAVPFSFAYTSLTTGTGALILFGAVQLTMLLLAVWSGERPRGMEWIGIAVAFGGLVYLVLPGLAAPSIGAAILMGVAGAAWGMYSLRGRDTANPAAETTMNFARAVPFMLVVSLFTLAQARIDVRGASLAVASGAVTSGLGYIAWYAALRHLTAVRAAVVQLAVPVLTAAGGVVLLAETVSSRLVLSAAMVLSGIGLTIASRAVSARPQSRPLESLE